MNKRLMTVLTVLALIASTGIAEAGGHHGGGSHSTRAVGVARASSGRIARSSSAKHAFMRQTGYPKGRPGYVVDHVIPLKRGGADAPSNMQWQTKAAAKAMSSMAGLVVFSERPNTLWQTRDRGDPAAISIEAGHADRLGMTLHCGNHFTSRNPPDERCGIGTRRDQAGGPPISSRFSAAAPALERALF
jgi:hypothetical protein